MNRTEDVDFANAKDDIKEGKAEGCMKETHDAASPADSGVKMVSLRDDSAEAAASFHDEETQVTANTTKKDAIEKQPPRGAAAAAESTVKAAKNTTVISSTKLKLIPISQAACQAVLREQGKGNRILRKPEYLVPGSSDEYNISRKSITLQMMWRKDANTNVIQSVSSPSRPTTATLGRNTRFCQTTGIEWSAISRNLCDVTLTDDPHKDSSTPIARLIMRKSAQEHAVCLNGGELNVPGRKRFRLKDGAVLSLYGPTGFAYRVELSHDDGKSHSDRHNEE